MPLGNCEDCKQAEATGYCVYCGRELCRDCSEKETCWKGRHKGSFDVHTG